MNPKSDLVDKLQAVLAALDYPFKHLDSEGLEDPAYLIEVLQSHLDTLLETEK